MTLTFTSDDVSTSETPNSTSSSSTSSSSSSTTNDDTGFFSTSNGSIIPFCGNGVLEKNEECDNGPLNDDLLYNGCTTSCLFGPRCGDMIVQKDYETCDDGTLLDDDICINCEIQESRTVFVTLQKYNGAIGNTFIADAICASSAFHADLKGNSWVAWISSKGSDAYSRLKPFTGWYVLPTDPPTLLFKGTEKLKLGMIAYPITVTEYGYSIENVNDKVWTATTISGVLFDNMDNCNEWQSSAVNHFAIYGSPFETNFKWTALNETSCDQKLHLYCIENN